MQPGKQSMPGRAWNTEMKLSLVSDEHVCASFVVNKYTVK